MHVFMAGLLGAVLCCMLAVYAGMYRIHIQGMHMIIKKHRQNRVAKNMFEYALAAYMKEHSKSGDVCNEKIFWFKKTTSLYTRGDSLLCVRIQTVDKKICIGDVYCNNALIFNCRRVI